MAISFQSGEVYNIETERFWVSNLSPQATPEFVVKTSSGSAIDLQNWHRDDLRISVDFSFHLI